MIEQSELLQAVLSWLARCADGECPNCHNSQVWTREDGARLCAVCHPAPGDVSA